MYALCIPSELVKRVEQNKKKQFSPQQNTVLSFQIFFRVWNQKVIAID